MMLREFTKDDVAAIQGIEMDGGPALGITAVDAAGAIIGYVLVYHINGRDWLCFWWRKEVPRLAAMLHRGAFSFMRSLRKCGFTELYTICDRSFGDGADRWMARLGFTPLATDEKDIEVLDYERQLRGEAHKLWLR